ncbi:MAG TPA: CHAD domain-containing protein [Ignavibacteria bacterium]|nr:CHAD domain-containing protein [Ignavibacteria bacterium]HMR40940.1 CHAD domain-containing protein [Ignavibacteria bacterium]
MKKISKYSAGLFSKLLENLSEYEMAADQETLHRIRITLKKIRSLFILLSFCDLKFNYRKQFHPFKKIYKEAGSIRSIFITRKLSVEYGIELKKKRKDLIPDNNKAESIPGFINEIRRTENFVYKKYFEILKHFEKINEDCYRKYNSNRKKELKNLVFPYVIESKLHNARKICKEITFLNELNNSRKINTDLYFEELQDLIGNWHDKIEFRNTLENGSPDISSESTGKIDKEIVSDLRKIKKLTADHYKNKNRSGNHPANL